MRKRCRTGYDVEMARRGYGSGTVYQLPNGRWAGQWSSGKDAYGQRNRGTVTADSEAAAWKALAAARGNSSTRRRRGGESVGAFMERWLEEIVRKRRREKTYWGYRSIVEQHITPTLGDVPLVQLDRRTVQSWANRQQGAPLTVQHRVDCLRSALTWAVKWDVIPTNPARGLDLPTVKRPEIRAMSDEDAEAIIAATAETWFGPLVALSFYTGMRQGELLGLRWQDVDLRREVLTVSRSLARLPGTRGMRYVLDEPKSRGSRRTIPLVEDAVTLLREHQRSQLAGPGSWKGLVFAHPDRPIDGTQLTHAFQEALKAAGLPRMRWHDIRHGTASILLGKGVSIAVVSAILGHSGIAITVDTYGHLTDETKRDALSKLRPDGSRSGSIAAIRT